MHETTLQTRITEVGRVMLPVSDQDAAIGFYTETLGFELYADVPFGDGDRWVEVRPRGGTTAVALVRPREGNAPGGDSRIAFTSDDPDADHARLRAAGVDTDPEVMRMGGPVPPMFFFRDPDGNSLLIVGHD